MQGTVDIGVVGVGFIGELHVRTLSEHRLANAQVVVDIDEQRAREVAETYDVPHVETDVAEAITSHDLDAVVIATPETAHRGPAETALEHDVDVLLEKPIAERVEDGRAIGEAVQASSGTLQMGFCCRFHPEYAALQDRIDRGEIGTVYGVSAARVVNREIYDMVAEWTHTMYYLAVHDIDMMRWYLDSEVETVYSQASDGLDGNDTPGVVSTTLRFENGAVGTLETNWARNEAYPTERTDEIRITGSDGHGRLVLENDDATIAGNGQFGFLDAAELHGRQTGMYRFQLDSFVEVVHGDEQPPVTWRDGVEALRVANAAIESMETDQPIEISSF